MNIIMTIITFLISFFILACLTKIKIIKFNKLKECIKQQNRV